MIKIANMLVTRKCNLKCSYCRISGDINYLLKPEDYPNGDHYYTNEKDATWWNNVFDELKVENPDCFIILYGGEPFMKNDLSKMVIHLNEIKLPYTIISNCTDDLKPVRNKFFNEVKHVMGFSASVDPGFFKHGKNDNDEINKSYCGFYTLKELKFKGLVTDPVAEITCTKDNIDDLIETVAWLSKEGIYSSVTVLDIARTNYHDFSSIDTEEQLVTQSENVKKIFDELMHSNYLIHMKNTVLPRLYDILPANLDCNLSVDNLHAICIDSDGSIRTCLRIKGRYSKDYQATDLFTSDRKIVEEAIEADKKILCKKGCSHTCYIMSQLDQNDIINHG